VRRSQDTEQEQAGTAQQQLLVLYGGAIKRYLVASLRDADLAEDLFQEFALKFVQGGFQGVDPAKGRFRSYVKTVLYRMVAMHYRKKSVRKEHALPEDSLSGSEHATHTADEDEKFLISWRDDLLAKTWQALEEHEQTSGAPYNTVLRMRVSDPTLSSEELAQRLTDELDKPFKAGAARVTLHRAREKFAHLMIDVIANSLEDPTREKIESELVELRLIDYCRDALDSIAAQS